MLFRACALLTALALYATVQNAPRPAIIGRWDLAFQRPTGGTSSGWLEVRHSGTRTLVGSFVGLSGSARPVYEVQVADTGDELALDSLGAVYGFLEPSDAAAKKPGEWQAFDITLVGRMVTVVLNGKTIIANREIPGPTGAALDSNEGEPGPLLLQGDHGPIEFRNLTIARPRSHISLSQCTSSGG